MQYGDKNVVLCPLDASVPSQSNNENEMEVSDVNVPSVPRIFKVGEWWVVEFPIEQQGGVKKYLGRILSTDPQNNSCHMTFLCGKETGQHEGFIYHHPDIVDEWTV